MTQLGVMDAKARINFYERKFITEIGKNLMFDVVNGIKTPIDALMYFIVKYFVKDTYKSLVDPTCGKNNWSFRYLVDILKLWNIEYKPCDIEKENWSCENGYSNCVCNVFDKESLPSGEAWFYDPPYLPSEANAHPRKEDYALEGLTVDQIKRYYSKEVFENFISKGAKLIIVKGGSFYYPVLSDNFFLFEKDIVEYPNNVRVIGRIIYRYYNQQNVLNNYRIAKALPQSVKRLQTVSSVFLILKVL